MAVTAVHTGINGMFKALEQIAAQERTAAKNAPVPPPKTPQTPVTGSLPLATSGPLGTRINELA